MTDTGFIRSRDMTADEIAQAKTDVLAAYPGATFRAEKFDDEIGEKTIRFTYAPVE